MRSRKFMCYFGFRHGWPGSSLEQWHSPYQFCSPNDQQWCNCNPITGTFLELGGLIEDIPWCYNLFQRDYLSRAQQRGYQHSRAKRFLFRSGLQIPPT